MMLFFDPISVNPFFVQYGVKKITTSVFFCIIFLVENRFDRDIFFVWFDYQNQSGEALTGVNYRADKKQFTHRRCKKLTSCQFLDDAKK